MLDFSIGVNVGLVAWFRPIGVNERRIALRDGAVNLNNGVWYDFDGVIFLVDIVNDGGIGDRTVIGVCEFLCIFELITITLTILTIINRNIDDWTFLKILTNK